MKTTRGFTLIELMIVVAIIAIMAAVGYPSYLSSVSKARRSDAQQLMLDIVNREEQFMLDARAYTANLGDLGISKEDWDCTVNTNLRCDNDFYQVSIDLTDPTAATSDYTINAVAIGAQASEDDLSINNTGAKTPADKW